MIVNVSASPGVFLCAPRHADILTVQVRQFGYDPIVVSVEKLPRTITRSGLATVIVDCRGAVQQGLSAVMSVAEKIRIRHGALLVLLQRSNVDMLQNFFNAGATHFLVAPFEDLELAETLRFIFRNMK